MKGGSSENSKFVETRTAKSSHNVAPTERPSSDSKTCDKVTVLPYAKCRMLSRDHWYLRQPGIRSVSILPVEGLLDAMLCELKCAEGQIGHLTLTTSHRLRVRTSLIKPLEIGSSSVIVHRALQSASGFPVCSLSCLHAYNVQE